MITTDSHMHSFYSTDCGTPMEDMIRTGIAHGLSLMCFTEHMDYDYPSDPAKEKNGHPEFWLDTGDYRAGFLSMKEKYADEIDLLFGVELGLQPHIVDWNNNYVNQHDFDYIIGSAHTIDHMDPYFPSFYEGRSERAAYTRYFEQALENLELFDNIDSFGHFDYVVRYGPSKNKEYSYKEYSDLIDPILRLLIEKGIALEINTKGYTSGLGEPNPGRDIISRYRELGGELITIGSDAHTAGDLATHFSDAEELLLERGYKYYAVFKERKPIFYPLG